MYSTNRFFPRERDPSAPMHAYKYNPYRHAHAPNSKRFLAKVRFSYCSRARHALKSRMNERSASPICLSRLGATQSVQPECQQQNALSTQYRVHSTHRVTVGLPEGATYSGVAVSGPVSPCCSRRTAQKSRLLCLLAVISRTFSARAASPSLDRKRSIHCTYGARPVS